MTRLALGLLATFAVATLVAQAPRAITPLPSFGEPGVSPDGSTVAFVSSVI